MRSKIHTQKFADLFKYYRLRAGYSSLRELSEEMADKGQYYDPSFYSHIQNGTRNPSRSFLLTLIKVFAERGAIESINEANHFFATAKQGYISRDEILSKSVSFLSTQTQNSLDIYKVYLNQEYRSLDVIDLLKLNSKIIMDARNRGHLHFSLNIIEETLEFTQKNIKFEQNTSIKKKILEIHANLLFEKAFITGCLLPPKESVIIIRSLVKELRHLAKLLSSSEVFVKSIIPFSFSYYSEAQNTNSLKSKKMYEKSINLAKAALTVDAPDSLKLICLRTIAASSMYLSDFNLFYDTEKCMRLIVNKDSFQMDYNVGAIDTIARGYAHFNNTKAIKILEESKLFDQKFNLCDSMREISRTRNEIEILSLFKADSENRYIAQLAQKGMSAGEREKVFRYQNFFQNHI